jgi:hypothetical protein
VVPPTRTRIPVRFGTARGLVNPGVNPGFIEPAAPYAQNIPGQNQYAWGSGRYAAEMADLARYNEYAPAAPYGRPNVIGTYNGTGLIRPDQLTMASQTLQQPQAQFPVQPQANFAVNPALLNTPPPPAPGYPVYRAPTPAQMATGLGPAAAFGRGLNYVPYPAAPVNPAFTPLGATTAPALTPQQLQQQLAAAADAAYAATPESGYYSYSDGA